jgi:hypothetical protein
MNYPENCGDGVDQTGEPCRAQEMAWIMAGVGIFFSFFSIFINNGIIYWHVRKTILRSKARSQFNVMEPDPQTKRLAACRAQAGLYVVAFLGTYLATIVVKNVDANGGSAETEAQWFWVLVLQQLFLPTQGLFNLLVFCRPKYLKARKDFPNETRSWAFRRGLFAHSVRLTKPQPTPPRPRWMNETANAAHVTTATEEPEAVGTAVLQGGQAKAHEEPNIEPVMTSDKSRRGRDIDEDDRSFDY